MTGQNVLCVLQSSSRYLILFATYLGLTLVQIPVFKTLKVIHRSIEALIFGEEILVRMIQMRKMTAAFTGHSLDLFDR